MNSSTYARDTLYVAYRTADGVSIAAGEDLEKVDIQALSAVDPRGEKTEEEATELYHIEEIGGR